MMSPRWHKVFQDLWRNKSRTALVVLSIAVGVFAVGVIASTRTIINRDLAHDYQAINPQSAVVYAAPFDDAVVERIRQMPEVAAADGRTDLAVKVLQADGQWKAMQLSAIPDFDGMTVNKILPESGQWPPHRGEMLVERASLAFLGAKEGATVTVKTPDNQLHELMVAGRAYDVNQPPVAFVNQGYGYISMDTLEVLGQPRGYTAINFTVATDALNAEHIANVAGQVKQTFQESGRDVFNTYIPSPGKHPADASISPIFLIMQVMAILTLLLSGFLVVNTVSAVLAEHIRQIGMMKAIGARRNQLLAMYAALVLAYGVLALLVAMPLGYLGTRGFVAFMLVFLNINISSLAIPPGVLAMQAGIALLVPLLAAWAPLVQGTRVTVREAVTNYGVGRATGRPGWIDRSIQRVRGLSRPQLLSLRNTFRRKGRLVRTLIVLTLGGATFISCFSVRASLLLVLDDALQSFNYDVEVDFEKPQPVAQLERDATQLAGVAEVETLRTRGAAVKYGAGSFSQDYGLTALSPSSHMLLPVMVQGRWLQPEDENAVVINSLVARSEPNLKIGDEITLRIGARESAWRVVGIARAALNEKNIYVPGSYYTRLMNEPAESGQLLIRTNNHTRAAQTALAKQLEERFNQQGMGVSKTTVTADIRDQVASQFNLIVAFLLVMSVLLAVVGALGLTGTMAINVLERTREIGVMRAIGASNGAIRQIVVVEGIVVGVVSWLLGALLAIPIGYLLGAGVGLAFVGSPLPFTFSPLGPLLWLLVVVVLAALASYLPARRAARLSVREVLAYE